MEKKIIVAGNWKMNPLTSREALALFYASKKAAGTLKNVQTIVCPPTVYLPLLKEKAGGHRCVLGAQDVFEEPGAGAHTGSVSAEMARNAGAIWTIVGHSERRKGGETNEIVNRKVHAALGAGLSAILCIGERERDQDGFYLSFIKEEIEQCLKGVSQKDLGRVIVAYEPIWAIGSVAKGADTPEDLFEMVIYMRKILSGMFNPKAGLDVPLLYGGSVDAANARDLLERGDVRGFLVGRASLNARAFTALLNTANS